ncbi:MAG: GntR family transcriptional regulator [Myxococcota bacterium]
MSGARSRRTVTSRRRNAPPRESTRLRAVGASGARKADRVADDLLVRIVSGEIAVGAVLPTEDELAERYGVNRSVVREAVKLLEVHGLVRPVRRRGTLVLDPMASISPRVLRAMLTPAPGRVDRGVLNSLLEIRAVLDVEMSTLAAARRTDAHLEAMELALTHMRDALGNQAAFSAAMGELTRAVARATGNVLFEMLATWHQSVTVDLEGIFSTTRPATEPQVQAVTLLVQLIREKDVDSVRQLVTGFHQWATPRLLASAALANGDPIDTIMEKPA